MRQPEKSVESEEFGEAEKPKAGEKGARHRRIEVHRTKVPNQNTHDQKSKEKMDKSQNVTKEAKPVETKENDKAVK